MRKAYKIITIYVKAEHYVKRIADDICIFLGHYSEITVMIFSVCSNYLGTGFNLRNVIS